MLPVLNWTAARSSDVVVQVLAAWNGIASKKESKSKLKLFCNVRHLQIAKCHDTSNKLRAEWVGESRDVVDGTIGQQASSTGQSENFDLVVMATGFGLEDGRSSYWRNETYGQPSLRRPTNTFLISGQGDGAMIDLLRLRISQFRQDRILDELFGNKRTLVDRLRKMKEAFEQSQDSLFESLEAVFAAKPIETEADAVLKKLRSRLRRDTEVVLGLLVPNMSELFKPETSRMSFQNALLVYLVYKCGGFAPSTETAVAIKKQYGIPAENHIQRHGTDPFKVLLGILSADLRREFEKNKKEGSNDFGQQQSAPQWPGGYFGQAGPTNYKGTVSEEVRQKWRKEYLPGPTAAIATSICGSAAAAIRRLENNPSQFRVTLHRAFSIGNDALLQQACDYQGDNLQNQEKTAGRTYPADFATIGYANQSRKIVRKRKDGNDLTFKKEMQKESMRAARKMRDEVKFTAAIPITAPVVGDGADNVVAILYVDSNDPSFYLEENEINDLCDLLSSTIRALEKADETTLLRIRNFPIKGAVMSPFKRDGLDFAEKGLELLDNPNPPSTNGPFTLNFDHTDLRPTHLV